MAEHPWELTLKQFVEQVRRDYGIEMRTLAMGERGQFLIRGRQICALPDIEDDDPLTPFLLRTLCSVFELPPLDFALDPEEEDD
jgi:hypothetical protein